MPLDIYKILTRKLGNSNFEKNNAYNDINNVNIIYRM